MSLLPFVAILGRQPELGMVELEARLGAEWIQPWGKQAALLRERIDINTLGGCVKLGDVLYRGPATDVRSLPLDWSTLPLSATKTGFGLSVYGGRETSRSVMAAGLEIKKRLRQRGSVRFVAPGRGMVLTAAEIMHNRLLTEGFELMVVMAGREMVVARTVSVQDIDWYSKRDYDRPARSAKVGMLPPKLAQVLINTTGSRMVADPFCGTGVVLQEARLLAREVIGSDIAEAMVAATTENMNWLELERPSMDLPGWKVQLADARSVKLPSEVAIVSEGYLGPNLSHSPAPSELAVMKTELLELYRASLRNWSQQLMSGAEVSLCVPAWRGRRGWDYLGLVDELGDLGYTLKGYKHVRTPLLYAREDQVVGRQLLLLRKN